MSPYFPSSEYWDDRKWQISACPNIQVWTLKSYWYILAINIIVTDINPISAHLGLYDLFCHLECLKSSIIYIAKVILVSSSGITPCCVGVWTAGICSWKYCSRTDCCSLECWYPRFYAKSHIIWYPFFGWYKDIWYQCWISTAILSACVKIIYLSSSLLVLIIAIIRTAVSELLLLIFNPHFFGYYRTDIRYQSNLQKRFPLKNSEALALKTLTLSVSPPHLYTGVYSVTGSWGGFQEPSQRETSGADSVTVACQSPEVGTHCFRWSRRAARWKAERLCVAPHWCEGLCSFYTKTSSQPRFIHPVITAELLG